MQTPEYAFDADGHTVVKPEMVFKHCIHGHFDESTLSTFCDIDKGTCLDWRKCDGRVSREEER